MLNTEKPISETEAVARGMDDWEIAYGIICGEILPDPNKKTPLEKIHGEVVEVRLETYYDVVVYEDGYEDFQPIGD